MEQLLSKLSELLKASFWQLIGAATGLACFVWLSLPDAPFGLALLEGAPKFALGAACILAGLALGTLIKNLQGGLLALIRSLGPWRARRREQVRFRNYIPNLTPRERQIVAFLIVRRQRAFDTDVTGEYAAQLIAQGFLRIQTGRNQMVNTLRVPVIVPDHIWEVMERESWQFVDDIEALDGSERPWSRRWLER